MARKLAALYDIHGNLPALSAVLAELDEVQPDLIVVGGDVVSGPLPEQTLARLDQLDGRVRWIRGNGDREVVSSFDGQSLPATLSERGRERQQWVAGRLSLVQREFLAQLPERMTLPLEGVGRVLFCHATPHSDEEIFTPLSEQDRLAAIFAAVEEPLVVCGHAHIQFERQVGPVRVVNAGSVGMPYADRPGAYWLLLTPTGPEFRYTPYDPQAAAQEIRAGGDPQAEEFARDNVLRVPTAAEAAEVLEQMAQHR